jgi:hypothetical protein
MWHCRRYLGFFLLLVVAFGCEEGPPNPDDIGLCDESDEALYTAVLAEVWLETDASVYIVHASGQATLVNDSDEEIFVPGCPSLSIDRWDGADWIAEGDSVVCVWEGLATPVGPGEELVYEFRSDTIGTRRSSLTIGQGCDPDQPLSEEACCRVDEVVSNEFDVEPPFVPGPCIVGGCSSQICIDRSLPPPITTCEFQPHYECFRGARCGPFGPGDQCQWESTPRLRACLEEHGIPVVCRNATSEHRCTGAGGSWQRGGLANQLFCLCPTSDGGTVCHSDDDCEGYCEAISCADLGGTCTYALPRFGCFSNLWKDGFCGVLCVD